MATGPAPEQAGARGATFERARLLLHRVGMPVIAAFLATLFAVSVRDGFPDLVEAIGTPILAAVALAAGIVAWRAARVSIALERAVLLGSLAVLAAGSLESALTMRFEVGYPYILGFLPLGYAGAFLFLGPVGGSVASLTTYLVAAAATLVAVSTGEIHLARGLPVLAGSPILIGLLYTLAWSLTTTADAHAEAEVAAATDPLTGALNRRSGEAALAGLGGSFALLVIDLDDFKRVNDERGHAFGDDVLVGVAAALRASVRPEDLVVRWGGDEFVVVAPIGDATGAGHVAERVRSTLADVRDGIGRPVAATVGVARHRPGEAWRATFERADAAMYADKDGATPEAPSDRAGDDPPRRA